MEKTQIEKELTVAIQNQMKAKDTVNKALNEFFEASRLRIEKEIEANALGVVIQKKSCCKSEKRCDNNCNNNCDSGNCNCS